MPHHLTAQNVKTLPVPSKDKRQIEYWDTVVTGFGVCVSYVPQRTWVLRYRVEGRRRRMSLASTDTMSLADARAKARKALNDAANGIDPAKNLQVRREALTFPELAAEYIKRHALPGADVSVRGRKLKITPPPAAAPEVPAARPGPEKDSSKPKRTAKGKKSWKEDRRIINNILLAKDGADWWDRKATDIARIDAQALHDAITDRGAPVMANRAVAVASKIFNFGIKRGIVDSNCCYLIEKNSEESRARVLDDDEIRELWAALGETEHTDDQGRGLARLNATLNDAFRMRFYTMQRGVEVFTMRWTDVDLVDGWWEIPPKYTKNNQIHRVPLACAAVQLLARRLQTARPSATWVFENVQPSKNPNRQFGNVRARGKKAAAFLSRGDAHLKNKRARTRKRAPFLPGLSFEFQGHDIRRTASTNSTRSGVRRDDVSKLLNHIDRGPRSTRVYDRYEYDAEKRAAMEVWARTLDAIIRVKADVRRFAQAGGVTA
jgi:integrase